MQQFSILKSVLCSQPSLIPVDIAGMMFGRENTDWIVIHHFYPHKKK
jgi:hypothetical protein